ncbi:hypothetical protein AS034_01255 [[Bacillus] enclensis]|uniref:DinB superfamily protein n=1 Tax=[Bacillus] enclensis TaxID=1402860 RepID=A0A0V8HQN4_9BACI|nr:DinB family protein [[Bacillus] enclensis]KSU64497.1 hypothetical protein AS034_01255 [[Bacillus] enclensis]SCB75074.1 DinB superfamily protein [[Bacillus] enclensis]
MNFELMDIFRMEFDFCWNKEAWFLPLESALKDLDSTHASWQPPGGGNTIWQIVNHLNYYNAVLIKQLNDPILRKKESSGKAAFGDIGEPAGLEWESVLAEDTFGGSGEAENTEKWDAVLEETRQICGELRKTLARGSDSQLDEERIGRLARQMLHNAYHIGQIVLIRKQQGSWPEERG